MAAVRPPPAPPSLPPPLLTWSVSQIMARLRVLPGRWRRFRLLVLATSHFLMKSRRREVGWSWIFRRLSFRNDGKGCFSRRVRIQKPPLPPFFIFLPTNWREDDGDLAEGSAGFTAESSPVSQRFQKKKIFSFSLSWLSNC